MLKLSQKRQLIKAALELYCEKIEEYLTVTVGPQLKEKTLDEAIQQIIAKQLKEYCYKEAKGL